MEQNVEHRSGMLVGREPAKPAKVTVLSNEKIKILEQKFDDELMPNIGVSCTMPCDDYQPPRLLSTSESEEIEPDYPLPKEGHIGYVKFENPNDYVRETEPRWIDVDEYEFEAIG